MSSSRLSGSFRLAAMAMAAALSSVALSGCENGYDLQLLYSPRTDWLMEKPPEKVPTRYNPPGLLPLTSLDSKGNEFGPDQDLLKLELEKNKAIHDPRTLSNEQIKELAMALRDIAGRPAMPKFEINDLRFEDVNQGMTDLLRVGKSTVNETLANGSLLYRQHCLHCHGLNGDGRGPTGPWVNPHPRDYRQGLFKFTSSGQSTGDRKPRRGDLKRTLLNGIEGTSMPSFHLLKNEELESIISYVIHLSLRGEAEFNTIVELVREARETPPTDGSIPKPIYIRVREKAADAAKNWLVAQQKESLVEPTPELAKKFEEMTREERLASAAKGYEIFNKQELGGCVKCHINIGRDSPHQYDAWGTIVRPRNLTQNSIRGGRRPIDLYWRIYTGINGSGMPALIGSEAERSFVDPKAKHLGTKEEWVWHLVNFIQIAPYPEFRKELREKHNIDLKD